MADSGQEFSGRSVDEAIAEGLAKLGLRPEQAEIEVLSKGSRGIFGLGGEAARVRISRRSAPTPVAPTPVAPTPVAPPPAEPKPAESDPAKAKPETAKPSEPTAPIADAPIADAPAADMPASTTQAAPTRRLSNLLDDGPGQAETDPTGADQAAAGVPDVDDAVLTDMAVEILGELVQRMGFTAQITPSWHDADDHGERYLLLDTHGHDLSALIGRRGETLTALQYLVRLMVNQRLKRWKNIVVDVEQYKERRVNQLTQLAKRMADQVAQSKRAVSLEPMPANERRIVHLALRDHPLVYTQSSGEGDRRKVHIVARD